MKKIVLASGSPRRAKILAAHGVEFEILKTDAPEISIPHDPKRTVIENACAKLAAAMNTIRGSRLVARESQTASAATAEPPATSHEPRTTNREPPRILAADTIVWFDGKIYGKPRDLAEAAEFLRELGGQTHVVFTGVAFADADGKVRTACAETRVTFHPLPEAKIAEYVERVKPTDRAGAYDIDESGDLIVASYDGSYENVMGLPVEPLAEFGILD